MRHFMERFEHWTRQSPDAVAVAFEGRELTYAELDLVSNQFAAKLWAARRSDNDILGYLGDVGIGRIVAFLGAIKANMALFRLDPNDPLTALRGLSEHAGAARVVAEPRFLDLARTILPNEPIVTMERLDPDAGTGLPEGIRYDPDALISIRYTSGSTGRPKGVPQTRHKLDLRLAQKTTFMPRPRPPETRHRYAVFNLFSDTDDLISFLSGDQVECFDFRAHGPHALADWLLERRITCLCCFTAMFRQLVAATDAVFTDIEEVGLVGEPPNRLDVEQFDAHTLRGARFSNRFGATEHGDVTRFVHLNGEPFTFDTAPMGPLLSPDLARLVDDAGVDAPDGQPGQLVVSAPYIPSAYHNDTERSAEVFKPDPENSDNVLCYTGFLAYRDYAGNLHPVGRMDEQIKIRGYNVRPTEVEQFLDEHPGVRMSAVAPFEGSYGIRRLACFFIPVAWPAPDPLDLRRYLAERVPNYMIPAMFQAVDALPMTGTGKIQRNALPDPLPILAAQKSEGGPQRGSPTETRIAQIWREVLDHENFGLEEDFFDVGGDSLQAMTMIMEIESAFGIRTPLESLILDGATVRALAERIDRRIAARDDGGAASPLERRVLLKRGGKRDAIFAMHVRGGHLSDYLELLPFLDGGRTVYGVHPRGLDGQTKPASTMADLAADVADTILCHDNDPPPVLLGYSFGTVLAFETAHALMQRGGAVSALILIEPIAPWTEESQKAGRANRARRNLRLLGKPIVEGDFAGVAQRLRRVVDVATGAAEDTADIEDAHRMALKRYRPSPLALTRSLVVSGIDNPSAPEALQEWRLLLGKDMDVIENAGDHAGVVKTPHVMALGQKLEGWLAEAAPSPQRSA